jgi:hypothetical protein
MTKEPELVCVRTCQGWELAQIYKSKLDAAEIPALLKYESAGLIFGITVDGLGQVRIMVPETYADQAEMLLADLEESETPESQDLDEPEPDTSLPA